MLIVLFKRLKTWQVIFLFFFGFCTLANAQQEPTAAPPVKGFSLQPDINGAASSSVNLFTGDVALPLNLVSMPSGNGLDVNVTIAYTSNVQHIVDVWNREAPAGILGLGWSMDVPKIVADHKQTGARADDEYYLMEGGISLRLIRTKSGSDAGGSFFLYETKNYKFWKIKYYYDLFEVTGSLPGYGLNKWEITKEDGNKYIYGDKNSGRNTLQYTVSWENWIGNSAETTGQNILTHAWNLSEIVNIRSQKITFEYENVEQFVGSSAGMKQTEASYLKSITDLYGRKVNFFYNEKDAQFFQEPHTERAEPDAYQEFYERKYLDHIDVLQETGIKKLSVHFGYSAINAGTSTAKMLLTSITEKNGAGSSLPPTQFEYYTSGDTKGFLKKITYPTKGTMTYQYTTQSIGHSDRTFTAVAPAATVSSPNGFAEPKAWIGENYVVVAWRALGAGGSHENGDREVRLYVYEWTGEWKEQFLQTISGVSLDGGQEAVNDYKEFQVVTEKDFFAVMKRAVGNTFHTWLYRRSENLAGTWMSYFKAYDYGSSLQPALLSGTNFVAAGAHIDDATSISRRFIFIGDDWREDPLDQDQGAHYYTSSNNFFISQNRNPSQIGFYYLTEDKNWIQNLLGPSLRFSSDNKSFWHSSNGMAVAMADDNPEYAYRWNTVYSVFYKDAYDKNGNQLFGQLADDSRVFIINNSFVAIRGRLARYDGARWSAETVTAYNNSIGGYFYYSYGEDLALRPKQSITGGYLGARKVFDPNVLDWAPDVDMTGPNFRVNVGIDYYFFGDGYYYRQPDGSWIKKNTFNSPVSNMSFRSGYPQFDVVFDTWPYPVNSVQPLKNGEVSAPLSVPGQNFLFSEHKFKSNGIGNRILVTYPATFSESKDATSIKLHRFVGDAITGLQIDHPVSAIIVDDGHTDNDGITERYTSFEFNASKATVDATGIVAQYNEVKVVPGSIDPSVTPYGYTKQYFFNGLTSAELGIDPMTTDIRWMGLTYETRVYENGNAEPVSLTMSTYSNFSRNLLNNQGLKVDVAYYVRPHNTFSTADGVTTTFTNQNYDVNTGFVKRTYRGVGGALTYGFSEFNELTYWWEVYDPQRAMNLLTPVIQTKRGLNFDVVESSATRWKNWPCTVCPSGTAPGILDSYTWKRTGSHDFTAWNEAASVPNDWRLKTSVKVNGNGQVYESTNIAGVTRASIWHPSLPYLVADVTNALSNQVRYESFEDCTSGCSTDAKMGSKSIVAPYSVVYSGETRTLSYWKKSPGGKWELIVEPISSSRTLGVSGDLVDEVRLHPEEASMVTYAYDQFGNVTAVCDKNNKIIYTEYDEFNRVKLLRDTDGNIMEHNTYNFKN